MPKKKKLIFPLIITLLHCQIGISQTMTSAAYTSYKKSYWTGLKIPKTLKHDTIKFVDFTNSYVDIHNPLGPFAQSMRNASYTCEKESRRKEKGLWIKLGGSKFHYKDQTLWTITKDYRREKINLDRSDKSLKKTVKSLQNLENNSPYARNIILTLQNSENAFTISIREITVSYTLFPLPDGRFGFLNNNAYAFQIIEDDNLMVDYAPFDKIGSGAEIRWTPELGRIRLAHELSHAYDANYGLLDDRLMPSNSEVMSAREIRALYHENIIRRELKMVIKSKANTGGALIWEGTPYTYPLPVPARY